MLSHNHSFRGNPKNSTTGLASNTHIAACNPNAPASAPITNGHTLFTMPTTDEIDTTAPLRPGNSV